MKTVEIQVREYHSEKEALHYPCNESSLERCFPESEEGIADYVIYGFLLHKPYDAVKAYARDIDVDHRHKDGNSVK